MSNENIKNEALIGQSRSNAGLGWQPIETAPLDNKRLLYLASFDDDGQLQELDFDGTWEYWEESWEMSHINGWCWMSAKGIEEPTHWAYQDVGAPPNVKLRGDQQREEL